MTLKNLSTRSFSSKRHVLTSIVGVLLALSFLTVSVPAQNPVPFLNQPLTPDAIAPGGPGFELTLNGSGFVSSSVVHWNGSARTTTFVNSSRLTATILASDIAKHGSGQITVVSPAPGGGSSNAIPFQVTKPISRFAFNRSDFKAGNGVPSVAVGDFNGDGNLDIAAVGLYTNSVSVYLGNGHGRFQPHGTYPTGIGSNVGGDFLVMGDFNRDGKLDLAVRGVSVLLGNGDGSFQSPLIYPAGNAALAAGDFNRDGKLDLASTSSNGNLYILLGKGDGTFQTPVSYPVGSGLYAVSVGDFNRDANPDLAVGIEGKNVEILLGNGDGTFQSPVNYASGGIGIEIDNADLNGDGILDLIVPNEFSKTVSIRLGNGDGTFQVPVDYPSGTRSWRGAVVADINGDGKVDLAITSWYTQNNQFFVLLGNGDGTFQKPRAFTAGSYPLGTAFGDFNNDGIMDMVIADQGSTEMSVMLGTEVELQPDTLDFGKVSVGKNAALTTKLTNFRKSTLQITNIGIPDGRGAFTQTNDCGNSVGGGQSCTITVTFTPPSAGRFIAAVMVKDKVTGSPQRILLSGRGSGTARNK